MSRALIVTADDFGMSVEVNEAVEEAHRKGILTCASLVVAGDAVDDALRRAARMPDLGVGLHLTLYGALASHAEPSRLAPDGVNLGESPASTGALMMFSPRVREAARREIAAQFAAYGKTGLALGHLDGHWHCHQHPAVLAMAIEAGRTLGLRAVRLPYEPWRFSRAVAGTGNLPRLAHALSHWPLAHMMRRQIAAAGLRTSDRFFGKTDAGFVSQALLERLAAHLPQGVTELGLHPATSTWSGPHAPPPGWAQAEELAALTSPRVRAALDTAGIRLIRWSDLP
mgnify:CR=1 FL=1